MSMFKCAACEAKDREIERLHEQLRHAMDLRAEVASPGATRRAEAPRPTPRKEKPRRTWRPLPGYELPPDIEEAVQFVDSLDEGPGPERES